MNHKFAAVLVASLALLAVAGCKAKKTYPDPDAGWHSADYSTIFGRVLRVSSKNPDSPPVWIVRFGLPSDQYHGEFALTPPDRLVGYAGGEMVQIRGAIRNDLGHPDYAGTWYEVHGIKLWENYR